MFLHNALFIISKYMYIASPTHFWRRQWQPIPVLLPGKTHDSGAWWAAVHGVAKRQT